MGFRSTFVTEDYDFEIPKWFIEKWDKYVNISSFTPDDQFLVSKKNAPPLSSKLEMKTYGLGLEMEEDIQRLVKEWGMDSLVLVWLHECGGTTRVEITKDEILYTEPTGWRKTDGVTHDYCYGCSDAKKAN